MIISSYNTFTQKYYEYDTDEVDESSPMFNKDLHNNDIVVQWNYPHKTTCAYCNTMFQSRNKLFNHLGYMGIDIRIKGMDVDDNEYKQYCNEKKRIKNKQYWKRKYGRKSIWKSNKNKFKIQKENKKQISSLALSMAMVNLT